MAENIPDTVQDAVDQYVESYQVYKQLEERIQSLRKVIEPFMKESGIDVIPDRKRIGRVQLTVQERAKLTSRYTTYEVEQLRQVLAPDLVEKCLVEVVDKDKVEALSKLGEIPPQTSEFKSVTPTYSLSVRFEK
ncbi:DUF7376 domain-containing protein [Alicyclobacillus acidiphilus]|uniref:DUF7376 domain-containing protein n=1 Tax=Alicyclobacillus acidiphilus TaxID=182455 RepID=UPI00082A91BF|nr:hypothetical protein [Alicyclobacillus acidiphilus]